MYTDARGGHNRKEFNKDFFRAWSPKMAYVLGYIYADGVIEDVRKSSRTCYLAITSIDSDILVKIRGVLSSSHNLYVEKGKINTFPGNRKYLCKKSYILRIGSKSIYDDLLSLGVTPRKSLTLTFPTIDKKYLRYFIRGYFDGDGCVMVSVDKGKKSPSIKTVFTCGSKPFLTKLESLLHLTIGTGVKKVFNGAHAFQLGYKKYDSLKILSFIYKGLKDAPYLDRKYNKYNQYLQTL